MIDLFFGIIYLFSVDFSSENGLFTMQVDYTGGTECFAENLILYENDIPVYTLENTPAHTFYITNIGTVFALSDHQLCFFGRDGNVEVLQDLHFPNGFGFSEDKERFFASDRDHLRVYYQNGEVLYELEPCRLFIDFQNGRFIAAVSNDTLIFYEDGQEVLKRALSTPYIRGLEFSKDNNCLIVQTPRSFETIELPFKKGTDK